MPDTHLPVEKLQELIRRHYAVWVAGRGTAPAPATALADCLIALKHNEEFWRELKELIAAPQLAGEWDSLRAGLPDGVPGGVDKLTALVDDASLDAESRETVLAGLRGAWQREDQISAAFAQERPEDIASRLQELVENSKLRTLTDRLRQRLQAATGAVSGKMLATGLFLSLLIMWLIMVLMSITGGESVSNNFKYKGVTPEPETA